MNDKKENQPDKIAKTLEERVDFLENKVKILENKLAALSRRINSSERSSRNQVDIW